MKAKIFATLVLVLVSTSPVYASEVTGTLTTGVQTGVEGTVIVSPTASPVAGAYTSAQSVTLTAAGSTSIRYTTDGTLPTCTTGTVYSGTIAVNASTAIQAISCYPNNKTSTVASHLYAINIPAPVSSGGGSGSGGGAITQTSTLSAAAQKVDSNKDGKIDVLDFVTLMANWSKTGSGNLADFNSDGKVDILDFVSLMANWTK